MGASAANDGGAAQAQPARLGLSGPERHSTACRIDVARDDAGTPESQPQSYGRGLAPGTSEQRAFEEIQRRLGGGKVALDLRLLLCGGFDLAVGCWLKL